MTLRVAQLTPPGTGAIATIAVVGSTAWDSVADLFRLANGAELDDAPLPGSLHFGKFGTSIGDEVVLAHRLGMSDPWFELHCHGGREVVAWIIEQLTERGATVVDWTELDRLEAQSWIRAEATAELSRALTVRTAGILLAQQQGALETELRAIRNMLATSDVKSAEAAFEKLLFTGKVGLWLTQPCRIAIFGPPNVGKSTLINRIAGYERAVISPIAGTTRELTTTLTAINGWPVELYDSPGIRDSDDALESEGVRRALTALRDRQFHLGFWMMDRTAPISVPEEFAERLYITVVNKCDLPADVSIPTDQWTYEVSALTGEGIPELLDRLVSEFARKEPPEGGVLFTAELYDAILKARDWFEDGQLQRSQQVLDALLQPEKPQFSILMNEPCNRRSDYAN